MSTCHICGDDVRPQRWALGYLARRIFKGESFTRSAPVNQLSFVK